MKYIITLLLALSVLFPNHLNAKGNSEAHFYPLQPVEVPKDFDCVTANANFKNGKWYTEESIMEIEAEENKVDNPKRSDVYILVGLLLLVIAIAVTCILYINRREKIYN